MSDKKVRQKQKAPVLTPEQQEAVRIEFAKRAADEKAERERIELYGKNVEKMSDRQIKGELRRLIKREYAGKPPEPQPGLTIMLGSILLTVMENTKTRENPFAKLSAYPL